MKTLPLGEWLWPLATAAASLLTWFGPRLAQKTVSLPMPLRPHAELPTDEWCPAHDTWFLPETECPGCREEWEQTWALGEEPEEEQRRRDDWEDQREERAAAEAMDAKADDDWEAHRAMMKFVDSHEQRALADAWYLDLCERADYPGRDPHHPWRDA